MLTPNIPEAEHRPNSINQFNNLIGRIRGCFILLIPLFIIFLSYGVVFIAPNFINQVKWQIRGSTNYKFVISKYGLLPDDIKKGRIVTVKDGEIVQVTNISLATPVDVYDIQTFDKLLNKAYFCPLQYPNMNITCSYEYDPVYGYPSRITLNCPNPDACYSDTVIKNVEIFSP